LLRVFCDKWDVRLRFPKIPNLPRLADLPKLPSDLLSYKGWDAALKEWEGRLPGGGMQQTRKLPMMLITAAVATAVCLLEFGNFSVLRRLENMTYDGRVRLANRLAGPHRNLATNLGLVVITDDTVDIVSKGSLGYSAGLLWPRSIYARALRELSLQGAGMVGFDVDFDLLRPGDPPVALDGRTVASDQFFADTLKKAGNAILATEHHVVPAQLFQDSAADLGGVYAERDEDGVLRRDRPYEVYRIWNPLFVNQIALEWHLDLDHPKIQFDSQDFEPGDIMDLQSFAAKLAGKPDPVSSFLRKRLDKDTANVLSRYDGSEVESNQLAGLLARALNNLVAGPSIYEDARFAAVKLRPETLRLLDPKPEDGGVSRLNRLLLEDAYPMELTRNEKARIIIPRRGGTVIYHRDKEGFLNLSEIMSNVPPDAPPFIPFAYNRVWSMGIVLAAGELKLDLDNPEIQPQHHRVVLHGENGVRRVIRLESDGSYYVNWELGHTNSMQVHVHPVAGNEPDVNIILITNQLPLQSGFQAGSFDELLLQANERAEGHPADTGKWTNRLVLIGSAVTAFSAVSDQGNTPAESGTILVLKHLNVANSMLTNRFVTTSPLALKLLLIVAMGAFAGWVTSASARVLAGTGLMAAMVLVYGGLACWLYAAHRFWLPVVLPLFCSGLVTHATALTYRVQVEQAEKKRVKSVFSKMLAPEVVDELLKAAKISMGGVRREITVYFADVRGFTALTDRTQTQAAEYVEQNKLSPEAAEAHYNQVAKETLDTVSTYLGTIAGAIKKHNGTLDKYIGDCVMAFWGGPLPNPRHACDAVRSAIDAQRAMLALNLKRDAENKRIAADAAGRAAQGLPPESPLPLLSLGTGINTGTAIMGLMGSDVDGLSYTVFGREVNLASRLEGLSGYGRIIISHSTWLALQRDDPDLAALCVERLPADVKGFRNAVKNYEVLWRPEGGPEDPTQQTMPPVYGGATGTFLR
jgi:class 3 adenylate cyclase/CHASE2 domain-containing sensor protein